MRVDPEFRPIDRRQPIRPQVSGALREAIVRLRLTPGQRLSENEIAQQMGVSRTPVREALIQLAEEGLVEIFPQVGTRVSKLKVAEIMEAHFIRGALECAAARLAARRMGPADLEKLRGLVQAHDRARQANDLERLSALDEEFHRLIIERSGFPRVWRLVRSARDHLQRLRNLMLPALGTAAGSVRLHREIVEGLASGVSGRAERLMRAHQDANLRYTQELMRRMPEYFEGPTQEFPDIAPPGSPGGRGRRRGPEAPRAGQGRTPRKRSPHP